MARGERIALAVSLLTLVFASSAHATVVTLGYAGELHETNTFWGCQGEAFGCPVGFTVAQSTPASAAVAPAAGVVTNWAMCCDGPVSLRVLEPAPGGQWRGAGTSAPATTFKGGSNNTELEIGAGDLIGADVGLGAELYIDTTNKTSSNIRFASPLPEAQAAAPSRTEPGELQLSATVQLTPVVSSLSPASGSTAGGNTVTITGKYMDQAVNVLFGKTPAVNFSVDLAGEHLTATAPPSSAGTVDVLVSVLHSTSAPVAVDRYTFVAPPGSAPGGNSGGSSGGALAASGFGQSASRWRLGSALPHVANTPVGTTFAFSLSKAGNVALVFTHSLPGRRVGRGCVAPSRANRGRPRCRRTVTVATLPVAGHAGLNKVGFQGRVSRTKRLSPGSYSVRLTTRDSHGTTSLTKPLSFTIVR